MCAGHCNARKRNPCRWRVTLRWGVTAGCGLAAARPVDLAFLRAESGRLMKCWLTPEWGTGAYVVGSGRATVVGLEESPSLRWRAWVDSVSVAVYDHMMVEPTQCGEVRRVMRTALAARLDVVGLQPVAGPAPVNSAGSSIAVDDETAKFGWDGPGGRSDRQGLSVGGRHEDFHGAITQDLLEGEGTDPGSRGDFATGFAVC